MDLPVAQFRTKAEQAFLDQFVAAEKALPGARDKWVAELRRKAIEAYGTLGLPHRRIEAWKYTDLRAALTEAYPPVRTTGLPIDAADVKKALGARVATLPAYRLVIVEGELRADLSDFASLKAAGVEAVSLSQALEKPSGWLKDAVGTVNPRDDDPVLALNAAFMTGGVLLRLKDGLTLDKPIHIINLDGTGEAASIVTRNLVLAGTGASAMVIESYGSLGLPALQRNAATEVRVGDKAAIDHVKFQREGDGALHLGTSLVRLGADARYQAFQFSTGAALSRNQIFARFDGENSQANISGVALLRGRQHCDTTILVEHLVPHCGTRELLKTVLDDEARGVFQGKIIVAPGAQKTDSKQMAQALLLGDGAEFDSKPELEIFADDVVCGHGSTSGQIDEDLQFYLEARGIPEAAARALLIQAFVGEALERVENDALRDAFAAASAEWLGVDYD
ncbi:MAG: Fe-S cluster assembly protein SufD [Methyloceanibacter sp.]